MKWSACFSWSLVVYRGLGRRRLLLLGLLAGFLLAVVRLSEQGRAEDWWLFCRVASWLSTAICWLGGLLLASLALPGELDERRAGALLGAGLPRWAYVVGCFAGCALYVASLAGVLLLAIFLCLALPTALPEVERAFAEPEMPTRIELSRDGELAPADGVVFLGHQRPPASLRFHWQGVSGEGAFLIVAPRVLHEGGGRRGGLVRLVHTGRADTLELELGVAAPTRLALPAGASYEDFVVEIFPGERTLIGLDPRKGLFGDPESGVFLAHAGLPAWQQFLRGMLLIFLGSLPLIGLGVAASTRLSGWVAVLLLGAFLCVGWSHEFVGNVLRFSAGGTPPMPGTLVLPDFEHASPAGEIARVLAERVASPATWTELVLRAGLLRALTLYPDFARYNPEPAFRAGRAIPGVHLVEQARFAIGFTALLLLVGCVAFRRRDLS